MPDSQQKVAPEGDPGKCGSPSPTEVVLTAPDLGKTEAPLHDLSSKAHYSYAPRITTPRCLTCCFEADEDQEER